MIMPILISNPKIGHRPGWMNGWEYAMELGRDPRFNPNQLRLF